MPNQLVEVTYRDSKRRSMTCERLLRLRPGKAVVFLSRQWEFGPSKSVDHLQDVSNRVCWLKWGKLGLIETEAGTNSGTEGGPSCKRSQSKRPDRDRGGESIHHP